MLKKQNFELKIKKKPRQLSNSDPAASPETCSDILRLSFM